MSDPYCAPERCLLLQQLTFGALCSETDTFNAKPGGVNMSGTWCPLTLMDCSLLANYYNQQVLEQAYNDPAFTLPNAIYIDAVDVEGGIRTGTELIHPLTKVKEDDSTTGGHGAARYSRIPARLTPSIILEMLAHPRVIPS